MSFQLRSERSQVQTLVVPWFLNFFHFLTPNKKMIEILTKILAKTTIIVVENREPYYFIIIYKCEEVPLSLFSYQMLASTFDSNERSSYYKVDENYSVFTTASSRYSPLTLSLPNSEDILGTVPNNFFNILEQLWSIRK